MYVDINKLNKFGVWIIIHTCRHKKVKTRLRRHVGKSRHKFLISLQIKKKKNLHKITTRSRDYTRDINTYNNNIKIDNMNY